MPDLVGLAEKLEELAGRIRFAEDDLEEAWELTDPDRRHHLVVVQLPRWRCTPDAVACSWPLPPPHSRPTLDVRSELL